MTAAAKMRPDDPPWLVAAFDDLGLEEIPGERHSARVVEMFAEAGHPQVQDDETAWCAAAVGSWLYRAGGEGTGQLTARSYEKWGDPLDTSGRIMRGAVLVFPRGQSSWQGHVCLCLEDRGDTIVAIGGNQRPTTGSVSVLRFRRAALLAARWPAREMLARMRMPADPFEDLRPPAPQPRDPWAGAREAPLPARGDEFPLRPGSWGERVAELQRHLDRLGYATNVDGDRDEAGAGFGNLTRDSVLAWQADNGWPTTGLVDAEQFDAIRRSSRPRPLSPKRLETTVEDLRRDGDKPTGIVDWLQARLWWFFGLLGIGTVENETGALDRVTQGTGRGVLHQVLQLLGANRMTFILLAVLALLVFLAVRRIRRARVEEKRKARVI